MPRAAAWGRRCCRIFSSAAGAAVLRSVLARIDSERRASLALHLRLGFAPVGVLREAGEKFGRRLDVILMQRMLGPPD